MQGHNCKCGGTYIAFGVGIHEMLTYCNYCGRCGTGYSNEDHDCYRIHHLVDRSFFKTFMFRNEILIR